MANEFDHRPVLLDEAIEALNIEPNGIYIDGTFGRGGHSMAILQRLDKGGSLLAIDKDAQAVAAAQVQFANDARFEIAHCSFTNMEQLIKERGWTEQVNGILLDLGVSSPQLDDASRGFSFRHDGALDMRMDTRVGMSAAQWIKDVDERELVRVFKEYGEERYARRIARAVLKSRVDMPITQTRQLADIIAKAHPSWEKGKDPATRCFQAIRIFINNELGDLQQALPQALAVLKKGGRLAVISFHSLEDRIVKRFMREQARGDNFPPDLPVTQSQLSPRMRVVGKAIKPGESELNHNPRARSSVLRIAEKI